MNARERRSVQVAQGPPPGGTPCIEDEPNLQPEAPSCGRPPSSQDPGCPSESARDRWTSPRPTRAPGGVCSLRTRPVRRHRPPFAPVHTPFRFARAPRRRAQDDHGSSTGSDDALRSLPSHHQRHYELGFPCGGRGTGAGRSTTPPGGPGTPHGDGGCARTGTPPGLGAHPERIVTLRPSGGTRWTRRTGAWPLLLSSLPNRGRRTRAPARRIDGPSDQES